MAGEEFNCLKTGLARVDDLEEPQRLLDAVGDGRVLFLEGRITDMAKSPVERTVKVCNARGDAGPDVVERSCRVLVGPKENKVSHTRGKGAKDKCVGLLD